MSLAKGARRALIRRASTRYGAGATLDDACAAAGRVSDDGLAVVIGFWDPPRSAPEEAEEAAAGALDRCAGAGLDAHVSVKAPALAFGVAATTRLAERARGHGLRLHVDAQDPGAAEATMDLLAAVAGAGTGADLGCTLPGRWRRSREDAERALELGLAVRLVKGQWPCDVDPGTDPGHGFSQLAEQLAGRARHVAIATHDAPLARTALRTLLKAGTPCELQLLFGLPGRRSRAVAREVGVRERVYIPWGRLDLPYDPAEARRRRSIAVRLGRDALVTRDGLGRTLARS